MKTTIIWMIVLVPVLFSQGCSRTAGTVSTQSLLDEMTNLDRLMEWPQQSYKAIQYSSYDRRSRHPGTLDWYANEDGFGGEPIPGFLKTLKSPDDKGIGEYLMCDVNGPGALIRVWTAGIKGTIRWYLDDAVQPFYEGPAEDFFWKLPALLFGKAFPAEAFRQFDAVYFPVPFSRMCRIEWIGDLRDLHFYHLGFKVFDRRVKVEPIEPTNKAMIDDYARQVAQKLSAVRQTSQMQLPPEEEPVILSPDSIRVLWLGDGPGMISLLQIRIEGQDPEDDLRRTILKINFDDSPNPQIECPLGDFFGAAPGICPMRSLPMEVASDGTLTCRFRMPYRRSVRIEVANHTQGFLKIQSVVATEKYRWVAGKSMHFRARWKSDAGLTASDSLIRDLPFLEVSGRGRVVGANAYVYNPSNVPTSWGNWWGEGDEKIRFDRDTFPSFFGTGTEDYFNYSWSSARIFSEPYCGQPRNDGPGNRGYVSNFRWHVADDLPFKEMLDFKMELRTHGEVYPLSYARVVYFYAFPDATDDYAPIVPAQIPAVGFSTWNPVGRGGSEGFQFIQAEHMPMSETVTRTTYGKMWAGDSILIWHPEGDADRITFVIDSEEETRSSSLLITLARWPGAASVSALFNGRPVLLNGQPFISLDEDFRTVLENYSIGKIILNRGPNQLSLIRQPGSSGKSVGIDFIWLKN